MASGTWAVDANGNWSLATNWVSSIIADGATFTANFTNNITATRTVTVDTVRTIGNITLSDAGASGSSWVLGGANTLTLDNGGSSPSLNVITASTISAPIGGTNGFTKAGAANLTLTNTANTVSGTITANAGVLYFGPFASGTGSANVIPNVTAVTVAAQVWYNHYAGTSFNNSATFTDGGAGFLGITGATGWTGNGIVFSAGQLVGLGPVTPAADRGLYFFTNESFRNTVITVADFPTSVTLTSGAGVATTMGDIINVATGAAGGTYSTKFYINAGSSVLAHTWTLRLNANQTAASPIILQGGIERVNTANTMTTTFTLGGTNDKDNTISGSIIDISGKAIAITKADGGRWVLSGPSSTYTGGVTISAGTLSAQSAAALGSSAAGAVSVTSGATLEAAFNGTINKASVGLTLNGAGVGSVGAISTPAGSYATTYSASTITLGSNSSIGAGAGSSLTLGTAITGAFALTKVLGGTLVLSGTTSSYTGKTTLSAGTLEFKSIANATAGNPSSLGNPTTSGAGTIDISPSTTLRYSGSTNSTTDRVLSFLTGGTYTLESTGAGSVNYAGTLSFTASTTNTLTLSGGSNATISSTAIANPAGGTVAVTKSGAGTWTLSATNLTYTGDTTVGGGTLNIGSTGNRTLTSNVVMTGGTLTNGAFTIEAATSVTATTGDSTINSVITGNKTLSVSSSTTLRLAPDTSLVTPTGNNTLTGAVTLNGTAYLSTLVNAKNAGKGSVLGTGNTVSVENGGAIYTDPNATQAGTARYNNLTFKAGSELRIGFTP